MQIEQSFVVARHQDAVWAALGDVVLVAECLPGAKIAEHLGGERYRGEVTIKLGPVVARFTGEMNLTRDEADRSGVVIGSGTDPRTSSRAQARVCYSLTPNGANDRTKVAIVADIQLTGLLAQFGKSAIINDIASRLTTQFSANLQARVENDGQTSRTSVEAQPIKLGRLMLRALLSRSAAWVRRILGTQASRS